MVSASLGTRWYARALSCIAALRSCRPASSTAQASSAAPLARDLHVAEGESLPGPIPPTGNTNTRCRFPPDLRSFIANWSLEGPTHHFALGVGHIAHLVADFARCWGIECVDVTAPSYRRAYRVACV